jgi:hypothetical protein
MNRITAQTEDTSQNRGHEDVLIWYLSVSLNAIESINIAYLYISSQRHVITKSGDY